MKNIVGQLTYTAPEVKFCEFCVDDVVLASNGNGAEIDYQDQGNWGSGFDNPTL